MKHSKIDTSTMSELGGARARFAAVAARWALDANAAARLLGLGGDWTGRSLMEALVDLDARAETCMRLACDVDGLLWRLVPDASVVSWLRSAGVGYEDDLVTPLEAMSTGPAALRGLRRYLEELGSCTPPAVLAANDP
jgi:hypothetical protein